ncbi:putative enzyme related to lactoylglutathione lyase [Salibacterium salarium]|uniref:VOC family protein n=1 Tax=Salibacterium salarium TaxID=284579 RepID=UPI00277F6886|nr:VOC family protein [Salibacterium salarium]MDQ0300646.1 putative enzyme related to lactoylglutathione lyase [Salibacterium salarium]
MSIKYAHTNIVANDWRKLSDFYIKVFNCKPVLPERDLSGKWLDRLTNIDNVNIKGIHLTLPGFDEGPTLEIFQYYPENLDNQQSNISSKGFGHIAFVVDNVEEVLNKVIEHGGQKYGSLEEREYESVGILTVVYAEDPEGNIIEIQNWK